MPVIIKNAWLGDSSLSSMAEVKKNKTALAMYESLDASKQKLFEDALESPIDTPLNSFSPAPAAPKPKPKAPTPYPEKLNAEIRGDFGKFVQWIKDTADLVSKSSGLSWKFGTVTKKTNKNLHLMTVEVVRLGQSVYPSRFYFHGHPYAAKKQTIGQPNTSRGHFKAKNGNSPYRVMRDNLKFHPAANKFFSDSLYKCLNG